MKNPQRPFEPLGIFLFSPAGENIRLVALAVEVEVVATTVVARSVLAGNGAGLAYDGGTVGIAVNAGLALAEKLPNAAAGAAREARAAGKAGAAGAARRARETRKAGETGTTATGAAPTGTTATRTTTATPTGAAGTTVAGTTATGHERLQFAAVGEAYAWYGEQES